MRRATTEHAGENGVHLVCWFEWQVSGMEPYRDTLHIANIEWYEVRECLEQDLRASFQSFIMGDHV